MTKHAFGYSKVLIYTAFWNVKFCNVIVIKVFFLDIQAKLLIKQYLPL